MTGTVLGRSFAATLIKQNIANSQPIEYDGSVYFLKLPTFQAIRAAMPKDFNHDQSFTSELEHIVSKREFGQLSKKLTRFTPFRVLRVEQYEIRHTNTLAWLLDPDGSHGMGRAFLDRFLRRIVGKVPAMETTFVEVHTELVLRAGVFVENSKESGADKASSTDRLDILVEGRSSSGDKWAVAIEAKINSHEGDEQLSRYDDALARQFQNVDIKKCYLTLDSDETVSSPHWQQIRWGEEVGKALDEALEDRPPADQRVKEFLADYQELIRTLSGQEDAETTQVAELANRDDVAPVLRALNERVRAMPAVYSWDGPWAEIYRKHQAAFDACRDAVREQGAALVWGLIDKMLAKNAAEWERISPEDGKTLSVRFVPRIWAQVDGIRSENGHWNLFYHAEFRREQKDVEIKLYVAPPGDRVLQKAMMRRIFGSEPVLRPDDLLKPTLSKLKNFMSGSGKTVKLYRQFISWQELQDGKLSVEDQFDSAEAQFENAVKRHTTALLQGAKQE